MDVMELAALHLAARRRTAAAAVLGAVREWRTLDADDLTGSWEAAMPRLQAVLSAGQLVAAGAAQAYTDTALAAQGVPAAPSRIDPAAFARTAVDGRSLVSLLYLPVIDTEQALAEGASTQEAFGVGERKLRMLVDTEVADAGRAADGVGITANRRSRGYVRMISGGACGRCALLAGKEYAFNRGFQRHPHCHCTHVPIGGRTGFRGRTLNARDYFDSLTPAQQSRAFTVAGARAIRDGADITAVVNARRGVTTIGSWVRDDVTHRGRVVRMGTPGRQVTTTTEGTTRRGLAARRLRDLDADKARGRGARRVNRLTPEAIYRLASDRDDAIRLLHRFGYLF
ncbi:hypothetical protein ACGFZP_05155 [Kitasatospora sp. NPDC048239]|uniref:VG15 protein n=1 Tax=Kitasatospora sp. NPDC048239 TaxID=3364046 RepID=UPI003721C05A